MNSFESQVVKMVREDMSHDDIMALVRKELGIGVGVGGGAALKAEPTPAAKPKPKRVSRAKAKRKAFDPGLTKFAKFPFTVAIAPTYFVPS